MMLQSPPRGLPLLPAQVPRALELSGHLTDRKGELAPGGRVLRGGAYQGPPLFMSVLGHCMFILTFSLPFPSLPFNSHPVKGENMILKSMFY